MGLINRRTRTEQFERVYSSMSLSDTRFNMRDLNMIPRENSGENGDEPYRPEIFENIFINRIAQMLTNED